MLTKKIAEKKDVQVDIQTMTKYTGIVKIFSIILSAMGLSWGGFEA